MANGLAEQLRPKTIAEIIGQTALVNGSNGVVDRIIQQKFLPSLIFYGLPGSGKTSLALVISNELKRPYAIFNAATDKKQTLVDLIAAAEKNPAMIIIIEEIHRLNRDRQDILLQYLEKGIFTLIACTTENPYFTVSPAVRSRCLLLELKPITNEEMIRGLTKILKQKQPEIAKNFTNSIINLICQIAAGDLRYAINLIESLTKLYPKTKITKQLVTAIAPQSQLWNFKTGNELHDLKSALQKSIRGSDPDAAIYYLARMLASGDYEALLRRLLIIAYEDIGLANPAICLRVQGAINSFRELGMPEGMIPLGLVVTEMALSEKSNSANQAIHHAYEDVISGTIHPIPTHLTSKGKNQYLYPPNFKNSFITQDYLPKNLKTKQYYKPKLHNKYERKINEWYQQFTNKKS